MYNNQCCNLNPYTNDICSCKDGILCALDWFYQSLLSANAGWIVPNSIKYYPKLQDIGNIIYAIGRIYPDIVTIYKDSADMATSGTTSLNVCKLSAFEFKLKSITTEGIIATKFGSISCSAPKLPCCKSGVLEQLLMAKNFLMNNASTNPIVTISTLTNSFKATDILALNKDTLWVKYAVKKPTPDTTYYVVSLCEIIGISFDKSGGGA